MGIKRALEIGSLVFLLSYASSADAQLPQDYRSWTFKQITKRIHKQKNT